MAVEPEALRDWHRLFGLMHHDLSISLCPAPPIGVG